MAKKNVRVVIPKGSPIRLLKLAQLVNEKHIKDGAGSLLNSFDMADYGSKLTSSLDDNKQAEQLAKDSEEKYEDRDLKLGISEDQSATTSGTIYFYLTSFRDFLLGKFKGQEQKLGEWGFEVNTTEKGKPPAAPTP